MLLIIQNIKKEFLESAGPKNFKEAFILYCKGFLMGMADIIPGVSGGTIALITGIYKNLINSISAINIQFFKYLITFKFSKAIKIIPAKFLTILFLGVISAIILVARIMHYFMNEFPTYTWSLFFGLILSSCFVLSKNIKNWLDIKTIVIFLIGILIGYSFVNLIPVQTPNSHLFIFLCGCIAICAMILPGISGSFILLILGKYAYVTGAIKNPFMLESWPIIIVFTLGCIVGIISFSKFLTYLFKKFENQTFCFLTGLIIGTLKKIWPFKAQIETKLIRNKVYTIKEINIFPDSFNNQILLCLIIAIIGFLFVYLIDRIGNEKTN
jgi:putative membrane protein